jgi:hypothetical protein
MKQLVANFLKMSDGLPGVSALTAAMVNHGSFKLRPIDKNDMNAPIAHGSLQSQLNDHRLEDGGFVNRLKPTKD